MPERGALLPMLNEVDDRAIVPIVANREVNPVPVRRPRHDDLVPVRVPHHRGVQGGFALVERVAVRRHEGDQVDASL